MVVRTTELLLEVRVGGVWALVQGRRKTDGVLRLSPPALRRQARERRARQE